jgi:hypothetical protein
MRSTVSFDRLIALNRKRVLTRAQKGSPVRPLSISGTIQNSIQKASIEDHNHGRVPGALECRRTHQRNSRTSPLWLYQHGVPAIAQPELYAQGREGRAIISHALNCAPLAGCTHAPETPCREIVGYGIGPSNGVRRKERHRRSTSGLRNRSETNQPSPYAKHIRRAKLTLAHVHPKGLASQARLIGRVIA